MAESTGTAQPIFVDVSKKIEPPHPVKSEEGNKDDGSTTGTQTSKVRIKCTECQRFSADSEDQLMRHIRKVHRGENPFQCSMCDYSTYNKAVFEEHVRVHQGIKPFKCSHCPYKSASKKNTKKHELIHRPNNPLKCSECPFIARHCKGLKKHLLTHGDAEFYEEPDCTVPCEKVSPRSVKRKSRHKPLVRKLFNCALCPWGSSSKPRILLHLIHHPRQAIPRGVDVGILTTCGIPVGIL